MSDVSISVKNYKGNEVGPFEANTKPLETTTLGINFDKKNDFSVPLQLKGKGADGQEVNGPVIYLRPDQIDSLRLSSLGGGRQAELDEIMGNPSKAGISAVVDGVAYKISNADIQNLHGTL